MKYCSLFCVEIITVIATNMQALLTTNIMCQLAGILETFLREIYEIDPVLVIFMIKACFNNLYLFSVGRNLD